MTRAKRGRPFWTRAEALSKDAAATREELARDAPSGASPDAIDLATLIATVYPALARPYDGQWTDLAAVLASGVKKARDRATLERTLGELVREENDTPRALRVFARREKLRVALREVLPEIDVDVTARELSDLADVSIDAALAEALAWAEARWGKPTAAGGARCPVVVLGMGKLGGRELNAGSDVDLLILYETDEGSVVRPDGAKADVSLHEFFARVTQRLTSSLDEVTDTGFVFRVDLRLRPEGARGPLVNALPAAERYYETWGRTWERAALLRARPCAGDMAFGNRVILALAPFVWRRAVDPRLAGEMAQLVEQARAEARRDVTRDLKIGAGGIREAEFFVQSLELIWGGRHPGIRSPNTLAALLALRSRGLVTDKEGREMESAYLALRRAEHRVQFATGLQTHVLPEPGPLLETIARSLGFAGGAALEKDLERVRRGVVKRLRSLRTGEGPVPTASLHLLQAALDERSETEVAAWLDGQVPGDTTDLARHLLSLARRPDFPLGAQTRDAFPDLAALLVEAILAAPDPEQAARLFGAFVARVPTPGIYARMFREDPGAARRMLALFGASAFLGEAVAFHPEQLADRALFSRGGQGPEHARESVALEIATLGEADRDDPDAFVGALRRARSHVLLEVGLADLAGEIDMKGATRTMTALADAVLEHATAFAWRGEPRLALIGMGKLGGREIGYGSDLDLFFVFGGESDDGEGFERAVRVSQRILRLLSVPHGDGPGYELDTRLRPSGQHGLLVVSLDAFARYHGLVGDERRADDWERQALLKARFVAGDAGLGHEVVLLAERTAYEGGPAPPEKMHRLRMRMEKELATERRVPGNARYDLKLGTGGIADVEFAVQWLQMKHGQDRSVRTTDTQGALDALEGNGYLAPQTSTTLRDGYRFLRQLEQRVRVVHGTGAHWIEEGAPGLVPLARGMGLREGPWGSAESALLARYRAVTEEVRGAYLAVLGLSQET